MIVQIDLITCWQVLAVWSILAAMMTIAIYPHGTAIQKTALVFSIVLAGPFVPLIAALILPKIASDLWVNYSRPSKNRL